MPLNLEKLLSFSVPVIQDQLTPRDVMLYALGIGLGSDPCDARQLRFVYEKDLQVFPTMCIVLAYPPPVYQMSDDFGVTASHSVHGEQGFVRHGPLPTEAPLLNRARITGVTDKGAEKGALIHIESEVFNNNTGERICTLQSTSFCRKDGGSGSGGVGPGPTHVLPKRAPDLICDLPTIPQAALLYRLSGDYNPLHAEPEFAHKAGFDRPILHGRCTFGVVGHAILKSCCDYDADRLTAMYGRFSSVVFPGETIRTEMWLDGEEVSFRATVPARGVTVMDNGRARVTKA